jgi:hypothetical protein
MRAAGKRPIDGRWLSYQIGQALGDDCIVFDDTIVVHQVYDYLQCARPGVIFLQHVEAVASDRDDVAIGRRELAAERRARRPPAAAAGSSARPSTRSGLRRNTMRPI